MKYLTLIRHAKSDWETNASDHERPLNERGRRNAPVVARFLARTYLGANGVAALLPLPERLVTSTALRAKTTAELMQPELGIEAARITLEPRAYLAEPKTLLQVVREFNDTWHHVMLFSHNSGISDFARKLLRRDHLDEEMPTCAAVLLELPWDSWAATEWEEARLVGYVTPRLIEKRFPDGHEPKPVPLDPPQ
jgi:phosphohistidine phosphatase